MSRKVFLEIASYFVMLLSDEAVVKSLKKCLWRKEESIFRYPLDQ